MAPQDHFVGSHYEAKGKAGPFGFLNPTIGYHAIERPPGPKPKDISPSTSRSTDDGASGAGPPANAKPGPPAAPCSQDHEHGDDCTAEGHSNHLDAPPLAANGHALAQHPTAASSSAWLGHAPTPAPSRDPRSHDSSDPHPYPSHRSIPASSLSSGGSRGHGGDGENARSNGRRVSGIPEEQSRRGSVAGMASRGGGAGARGQQQDGEEGGDGEEGQQLAADVYHVWRSRDNRKGRHALAVVPPSEAAMQGDQDAEGQPRFLAPEATSGWKGVKEGLKRMLFRWPVWDVSFDVAVVFTLGSAIWVINGFFVWLPLAAPDTEFANETSTGGGVTALIGATIFEFGSILLMLEAVNENRADCFGWALEAEVKEDVAEIPGLRSLFRVKRQEHDRCNHSHRLRTTWLRGSGHCHWHHDGRGAKDAAEARDGADKAATDAPSAKEHDYGRAARRQLRVWAWWPSWYELRTHYVRDVGFLACAAQMFGATVFWISGFTGMPGILDNLSHRVENGVFWTPQVVGGTGFIVSSFLFMVEVQRKWYIPEPSMLGWHIGFWNLVGALGFTLCGALGFAIENSAYEYASGLSTFIGSWAFLIGSLIQWYESLDKYPVTVEKDLDKLMAEETDWGPERDQANSAV